MSRSRWGLGVVALAAISGCGTSPAPTEEPAAVESTRLSGAPAGAVSSLPSTGAPRWVEPAGAIDAGPGADAGSSDAGAGPSLLDAGARAEPAAHDPLNRALPPLDSDELQARARALFEAIVANDAARGESFWFPKEPFIPLKDVKGPDRYWDGLHKVYANDIAKLHRKRKSWGGAVFKGFTMGSTPKWVKPGEEANKIGYHRSFRGKIRYEIGGEPATIDVHVVISWQGRWYITHLSKFKK